MSEQALTVKEKIGYGMGDAASHIVFDNVMLYMMFFYTISSAFPPVSSARCFCWPARWMRYPTRRWG